MDVPLKPHLNPHQYGMDILFPTTPLEDFFGFPVFEARVQSTGVKGYGSLYGWIRLFKCIDTAHPSSTGGLANAKWEMNPIPISGDLNIPFCYFGQDPTLFDGPLRLGEKDVNWVAQAFLTYIPDAILSKAVKPIAAFEWRFEIQDGKFKMKSLRDLNLNA